ncbi:MAG TPA: glycoside hydrolase family 43 protein [Tepidisphaeraceae bacterium]|jgi:beta-xylosidase|nr:glycoside hydrolase family 43 protein [Tepidisphaeraceae bacterium]
MDDQLACPDPSEVHYSQLRIRDPFIVPVIEERKYYLFGTTSFPGEPRHFDCYVGTDLMHWHGPHRVFSPRGDYWGTDDFWASEVHRFGGKYFLFATFKAPGRCRGTDILMSATDSPRGPYVPHTASSPITPHDWECLDGTLFVDNGSEPWLVFCHEWAQVHDGKMCAVQLSPDLTRAIGEPAVLFTASKASWSVSQNGNDYVTDGPFLHRTETGKLLMLWSSFHTGTYCLGVARSESGTILGPWHHDHPLLLSDDGGHGMLFHDFDGRMMLALHRPNKKPLERPVLLAVEEAGDELRIVK